MSGVPADLWKVCDTISCHAWSPDKKSIAICPNTEEVFIYENANDKDVSKWVHKHTLTGHDLLVSGIDWSPVHNKIVTCSHDRNAFVWTFVNGEWKPSLSILRINRAALAVRWSPDGKKFAVASGARVVPVCHYEEQNDWWISKMIKKHKSTVLDVAWHPNSQFLATSSSDFRCRIFSAFVENVDTPVETPFGSTSKHVFGDEICELEQCSGWVESCAWSPSGKLLAYVGHDSSLTVTDISSGKPVSTTTRYAQLPCTKLIFLSEKVIAMAGHSYNPLLFQDSGKGKWEFVGYAEEKPKDGGAAAKSAASGFDKAKSLWANKTTKAQDSAASEQDAALWTRHKNQVSNIVPYADTWSTTLEAFSTCGMDGAVAVWRVKDIKNHLKTLAM